MFDSLLTRIKTILSDLFVSSRILPKSRSASFSPVFVEGYGLGVGGEDVQVERLHHLECL
jgi:hypothetical protein